MRKIVNWFLHNLPNTTMYLKQLSNNVDNRPNLELAHSLTISLILPMYNESLLVKRKINEVLEEIYYLDHVKLIIVDSNSTDETSKIAESTLIESELQKDRWRVLRSEVTGKTRAINFGISKSNSELIMIMDTDAEASKGWENICQEIFKDKKIGLVSGIQIIDEKSKMNDVEKKYKYYSNKRRLLQSKKNSIIIPEGSMCCFRRSAIKGINLDERFNADDTQICLICLRNKYICLIDDRMQFKENQRLPWKANFKRRVRRGRGLINVLLRNLDMMRPTVNSINHKEFINSLIFYLFVPYLVIFTIITSLILIFRSNLAEINVSDFSPISFNNIFLFSISLFIILMANKGFRSIISLIEGSIIMIIAQISVIFHKNQDAWETIREIEYIDSME